MEQHIWGSKYRATHIEQHIIYGATHIEQYIWNYTYGATHIKQYIQQVHTWSSSSNTKDNIP